jgi:hypothetical protein
MTDDVLDALDRMIAGFGKPDLYRLYRSEAPTGHNNREDFHGVAPFGRFVPGKTDSMGEIHSQKKDSLDVFHTRAIVGARVWKIPLVQPVQTGQSRRNPGPILAGLYQSTGTNSDSFTATPAFRAAKREMRWHLEHGERVPRDQCAGCRMPLGDAAAMDLADGNRVHLAADYACLIAWGEVWRAAAKAGAGIPDQSTATEEA